IAEVIEQSRIGLFAEFDGFEQRIERLLRFAQLVIDPGETVEVSSILRLKLDRLFNHLTGLLEILAAIGPHVTEIIEGFSEIRLHLEAFAEIFLGFIDSLAALISRAELEIEKMSQSIGVGGARDDLRGGEMIHGISEIF